MQRIQPRPESGVPLMTPDAGNLLGVDPQPVYGAEARDLIAGRVVLVTGAGGSIGSELARQLTALGAARVACADRDEYALYRLSLSLTGTALLDDENLILADVTSRPQMQALFASVAPDLVFHAAACKHLPLLERAPAQAILANVAGTANVAEAAAASGAQVLVNISTDKAASPVSVLGYSKRLAEITAAQHASDVTRVASVRFGNVFASRGSFMETLAHQVGNGLPVTVTDPAMTRYFMTIPQAAGLVIEAAVMAGSASVFVLDMGEPHSITGIVRRYAAQCGIHADIRFTGRRPGEKLSEELTGPGEDAKATAHPRITAIPVNCAETDPETISALCDAAARGTDPGLLRDALEILACGPAQPAVQAA